MSTRRLEIEIADQTVEVIYKEIKNLHLSVHPPAGRVRVAAPTRLDDEAVRLAVVSRLAWIRKQQERLARQVRLSAREMVTGESHYFRGRRYRLTVCEGDVCRVSIARNAVLALQVRPGYDASKRERVLQEWYREELRSDVVRLVEQWAPILEVSKPEVGIKRMKTRWGTCNPKAQRVWLNLELAKKSPMCMEYVLVHEMVHLLEPCHDETFIALMDKLIPQWRLLRDELNRAPLAHENWTY